MFLYHFYGLTIGLVRVILNRVPMLNVNLNLVHRLLRRPINLYLLINGRLPPNNRVFLVHLRNNRHLFRLHLTNNRYHLFNLRIFLPNNRIHFNLFRPNTLYLCEPRRHHILLNGPYRRLMTNRRLTGIHTARRRHRRVNLTTSVRNPRPLTMTLVILLGLNIRRDSLLLNIYGLLLRHHLVLPVFLLLLLRRNGTILHHIRLLLHRLWLTTRMTSLLIRNIRMYLNILTLLTRNLRNFFHLTRLRFRMKLLLLQHRLTIRPNIHYQRDHQNKRRNEWGRARDRRGDRGLFSVSLPLR